MKKGELKNVQNQIISANTHHLSVGRNYWFLIVVHFFTNFSIFY